LSGAGWYLRLLRNKGRLLVAVSAFKLFASGEPSLYPERRCEITR
jgi:hypothetical protein